MYIAVVRNYISNDLIACPMNPYELKTFYTSYVGGATTATSWSLEAVIFFATNKNPEGLIVGKYISKGNIDDTYEMILKILYRSEGKQCI